VVLYLGEGHPSLLQQIPNLRFWLHTAIGLHDIFSRDSLQRARLQLEIDPQICHPSKGPTMHLLHLRGKSHLLAQGSHTSMLSFKTVLPQKVLTTCFLCKQQSGLWKHCTYRCGHGIQCSVKTTNSLSVSCTKRLHLQGVFLGREIFVKTSHCALPLALSAPSLPPNTGRRGWGSSYCGWKWPMRVQNVNGLISQEAWDHIRILSPSQTTRIQLWLWTV